MPTSAEKSRERVKRWKKENPEKYKEQKKRYKRKHANANYEQVKTWRRENPDLRKTRKQRERRTERKQATEQHDSSLAGFQCSDELEIIVNMLMANVDQQQPLKVINFDCDEAIASEQQQQEVIANFDVSTRYVKRGMKTKTAPLGATKYHKSNDQRYSKAETNLTCGQ